MKKIRTSGFAIFFAMVSALLAARSAGAAPDVHLCWPPPCSFEQLQDASDGPSHLPDPLPGHDPGKGPLRDESGPSWRHEEEKLDKWFQQQQEEADRKSKQEQELIQFERKRVERKAEIEEQQRGTEAAKNFLKITSPKIRQDWMDIDFRGIGLGLMDSLKFLDDARGKVVDLLTALQSIDFDQDFYAESAKQSAVDFNALEQFVADNVEHPVAKSMPEDWSLAQNDPSPDSHPRWSTPVDTPAHHALQESSRLAKEARRFANCTSTFQKERLVYVEVAEYAQDIADTFYAGGDDLHGWDILRGANALLDDVFLYDRVKDSITRGSTFLAGIVSGFTGLPGNPIDGYGPAWHAGRYVGSLVGLGADAAWIAQAFATAAAGDALAIGTVGALAPAAVSINLAAAAQATAAVIAGQGHWERLQKAQQALSQGSDTTGGSYNNRFGAKKGYPKTEPIDGKPKIEWGKQDKHYPDSKHFEEDGRRSVMTHGDPQALINGMTKPGQIVTGTRGKSGFKERYDFGETIGIYRKDLTEPGVPTSIGIIHYSKRGAHIVPGRAK